MNATGVVVHVPTQCALVVWSLAWPTGRMERKQTTSTTVEAPRVIARPGIRRTELIKSGILALVGRQNLIANVNGEEKYLERRDDRSRAGAYLTAHF
jgi:hypothetical protein